VSDWALRRASTDALVALFGIALAAAPVAGAAEAGAGTAAAAPATLDSTASLEGLPIARVDLEVRDIFECQAGDPFVSFYRLANALHIRTRDRTVRQQLLFAPGERWSEERGAETARTLRSLDYLEPQRMEARRENDSVVVEVETRDAWTTSPLLNLERGGGVQYGTVGLTERNLLGLGEGALVPVPRRRHRHRAQPHVSRPGRVGLALPVLVRGVLGNRGVLRHPHRRAAVLRARHAGGLPARVAARPLRGEPVPVGRRDR
jgi:hypothetical protein